MWGSACCWHPRGPAAPDHRPRRGNTAEKRRSTLAATGEEVSRSSSTARRAPVRRHHDRGSVQRRVHRRDGNLAPGCTARNLLLYLTVIATAGSETTHPVDRCKTLCRAPESAPRTNRTSRADSPGDRGRSCARSRRRCRSRAAVTTTSTTMGRDGARRSAMLMLVGAANRDHRRASPDGDAVRHPP